MHARFLPREHPDFLADPASVALVRLPGAVTNRSIPTSPAARPPGSTSPRHLIDPAFTDLPLRRLADAALSAAKQAGASYADFRFERLVTADLTIRDTAVQSATDGSPPDTGFG